MRPDQHVILGERDFGAAGLEAIESIGPFVEVQILGPLLNVHDARIVARHGIGHHPHRWNERLFYIMEGQLDHDDALNRIKGHMDTGDVGQFTEGRRGMIHSEWNPGDTGTHAFILVYLTDPVPEQTRFAAFKDADAPRYDEGEGVRTKELVGTRSSLRVNGDIRFFSDSRIDQGAALDQQFGSGEGGLVSVQEGAVQLAGEQVAADPGGVTVLFPPAERARTFTLSAVEDARVIRVAHGPSEGFVVGQPHSRR